MTADLDARYPCLDSCCSNGCAQHRTADPCYCGSVDGGPGACTCGQAAVRDEIAGLLADVERLEKHVETSWEIIDRRGRVIADLRAAGSELLRTNRALMTEQHEVDQILGKALGCPEGFPDVNPVDDGSVETGEHTIVSLAHAAAAKIAELRADIDDRDETAREVDL